MTRNELKKAYIDASQKLGGKTPSDVDISKLYEDYLAGVEFTECDNEVLFEAGENGELEVLFRPVAPFGNIKLGT